MSGTDFIRKVDVFPVQLLDNDIKLVCSYDISPSSFPNTRLELVSNTYQLYRFTKVKITYTSMLPTAVNGLFVGYIDTDPSDESVINSIQTANDVLRIARSHQGSHQGKIRDNWSFTMPQRSDDQFFFIGDGSSDSSDKRFRKMGTLYIFQLGQATTFDGKPLDEELSAGALNIEWSCDFMNPQLQSLVRVYDGITEKDVYRITNGISWYRSYSQTSSHTQVYQDTRFRHLRWIIHKDLFVDGSGDYVITSLPISMEISRGVKSVNSVSLPYSNFLGTPYGTTLYQATIDNLISKKEVVNFLNNAFKFAKGAIAVAKEVYDVISLISSVFIAGIDPSTIQNQTIDDPADVNISHSHESLPLGQVVIHYDGINAPVIEDFIEYESNTIASNSNMNFTCVKLFIAWKIKRDPNDGSIDKVLPSLPYLKKLDNA